MKLLGIAILIWLAVGFLVAIKQIYIDRKFTDEFWNEFQEEEGLTDEQMKLHKNKTAFIIATTLSGFFSFWADTQRTFSRKHKK